MGSKLLKFQIYHFQIKKKSHTDALGFEEKNKCLEGQNCWCRTVRYRGKILSLWCNPATSCSTNHCQYWNNMFYFNNYGQKSSLFKKRDYYYIFRPFYFPFSLFYIKLRTYHTHIYKYTHIHEGLWNLSQPFVHLEFLSLRQGNIIIPILHAGKQC